MLRRIENGLLRRTIGVEGRQRHDRKERIARHRIDLSAQHADGIDAVDPGEPPIERALRVIRSGDIGLHVPDQHAVADHVRRLRRPRQERSVIVEC